MNDSKSRGWGVSGLLDNRVVGWIITQVGVFRDNLAYSSVEAGQFDCFGFQYSILDENSTLSLLRNHRSRQCPMVDSRSEIVNL